MNRKIDVYLDVKNRFNAWGIITYVEYQNHLPRQRQEVIRFDNPQIMLNYLKMYFQPQEVFQHQIDYDYAKYRFYDGKPELDYITIKCREYDRGKVISKKIKLPKEFEKMCIEIIKANKGISRYENLDSRYYRDVDVYKDRKDIAKSAVMSIGEFFDILGDRIRRVGLKGIVSNLKIIVPLATLVTLIGVGFNVVSEHNFKSRFLIQKNPLKSVQDLSNYIDKARAGDIIEKLMTENYNDVSEEDINFIVSFTKRIDNANYDQNASFNTYDYKEYFHDAVFKDKANPSTTQKLLEKLDELYRKSFVIIDDVPVVNQDNAKKYLSFVCSLTFMYDTYHTDRTSTTVPSDVKGTSKTYATQEEIQAYDNFPTILKFIELRKADGLMRRTNYEVSEKPIYYWKTEKVDIQAGLMRRLEEAVNVLREKAKKDTSNRKI